MTRAKMEATNNPTSKIILDGKWYQKVVNQEGRNCVQKGVLVVLNEGVYISRYDTYHIVLTASSLEY